MSSPLVVLGGMFDPVHKGHVSAADYALEFLSAHRLKMVPCHRPNHKAIPDTRAEHRLAMLEIATAGHSQIEIDTIELQVDRVSYTVDTLTQYRKQHETIVFVLGVDSFNSLPQWHEWQQIFELCHLLVLARPGAILSDATLAAVQGGERKVETAEKMLSSSQGRFIYCENFEFDMASSQIRKKLARGEDVTAQLDPAVIEYIHENNLYQD